MIRKLFRNTLVRRRMAASHLGIILSRFALYLHARGYSRGRVHCCVQVAEHFSRWMGQRAIKMADLDENDVEQFVRRHLPRCRCPRPAPKHIKQCRTSLTRLLSFLRQRHLIRPFALQRSSAGDRLLDRYDRHLNQVAGLTFGTRVSRLSCAKEFLRWRFGRGHVRLGKLIPEDVNRYIQERALRLKSGSIRTLAMGLRSFMRFLHFVGRGDKRLAEAVVCPAPWPHSPIPRTLSELELRTFLGSFDRTTKVGRRDFAMALCLCRLGLRAHEVASLNIEDVNWRTQTMHLRDTKSRRGRDLPLPVDVARAIADYLRKGRPATSSPAIFVRHLAPIGKGQESHLVRRAMQRAFVRARLPHTRVHLLRHTFATRLHCRGIDIKTIADLLGHVSLDTTAHYARVDKQQLRQAALPWPEDWA